jgi:hypothetical protein
MTYSTTDCYSPRTVWVEGYILTRAEGRATDKYWPLGRTLVRASLHQFDDLLRLAASKLEHAGYDKFDLVVVYSDGEQQRLRLDLDRDFHSLREHFPSLYR